MNCVELVTRCADLRPSQIALMIPGQAGISYAELQRAAAGVQQELRSRGLRAGDSVLIFDQLSYRLYGAILGMLASGVTVQLIEPWMPVARIERVVEMTRPKAFWCNWIGRIWGSRVRAIRNIPVWLTPALSPGREPLCIEQVPSDHAGIITFTSGTTGSPKGVSRTHGYLKTQHEVLSEAFEVEQHRGPDLCVIANFALSNLAAGRSTILMPSSWKPSLIEKLQGLPPELQPVTSTCGPAFLLKLLRHAGLPRIESIHVGGALTDCWIFEEALGKWRAAEIGHVYGSSEVEPVAVGRARDMVDASRSRGYFQTLALGRPVPQTRTDFQEDGLWVTGPHVSPKYVGNDEENRKYKRLDDQGRTWHFMGDRIQCDQGTLWYAGRSAQSPDDFALEQQIYFQARSSTSFIHRTGNGERILVGCGVQRLLPALPASLRSSVSTAVEVGAIRRDRRHRARIDRVATLQKELSRKEQQWLLKE